MEKCNGCSGCNGCDRSLLLTDAELALLKLFATLPFLPVARKPEDTFPVFFEGGDPAQNGLLLACLEKKGLIDIDYHCPLVGFDYSAYKGYRLQGSMALTLRGQEVLDTLEFQGAAE